MPTYIMIVIESHRRRLANLGLLALVGLFLSTTSPAQNSKVNLSFVSFPKVNHEQVAELRIGEGETIEVELPTNSLSKTYEVPAMQTWVLGNTSVNEVGRPIFVPYGQVDSTRADHQLILVLRKGDNESDGLTLVPIDFSSTGFDGGKYLLINVTKADIAGKIGTANFALKPGAHGLIAPQPSEIRNGRKYSFAQVFFRVDEEIQPFFSATWRFNERARSIVFFYHDPTSNRLRLHTIRDYVP